MEQNVKTLPQIICEVESAGTTIKAGSFECMTDFLNYFDVHYKPILEQLQKEWTAAKDARRFLADDLLAIFDSPAVA